ncbi:MAG: D-alanine--D-alanine ligase [Patescibacteria group bacterium]
MEKLKIAVLLGGESSEREVSLDSGAKVAEHIPSDKYEVLKYDPKNDLQKLINDIKEKRIDVVFPILHGKYGEDGTMQGLLELLHIPYVGCGVLASALAMDKIRTKKLVESFDIVTPGYRVLTPDMKDVDLERFTLPCVVKPKSAGSSVGVSIPEKKDELKAAIDKAFEYDDEVLVEDFIKGDEYTVGVIGPNDKATALPVTHIKANKGKFYDYKSKYAPGGSTHTCPAEIDDILRGKLQTTALEVYRIMGCEGMSRIDFMVDQKGNHYFIEVNTIPGMTDTSLLPEAAKAGGIEFPKLLNNLIQWGLRG